ncbi:MAG: aminodeoxychorismate synthase component I [bacterium]
MILNRQQTIDKINEFTSKRDPFLFVIDFDATSGVVLSPEEAAEANILFNIRGKSNYKKRVLKPLPFTFDPLPVSPSVYKKAFNRVLDHLNRGDTYLINLTFQTEIKTNLNLKNLFHRSEAPFRLLFDDQFVVFSPESFVEIKGNKIYSFPMKGTIDASIPKARHKILDDKKELYEHTTIVDLIRNDLSMVSSGVEVKRFRYIDLIRTNRNNLLQVSSEICGTLESGFRKNLGEVIFKLLPAGSVTGAPKEKTVRIIRESENYRRGFYTGIFGYWDGYSLQSGVMIRFIENENGKLFFKSGGGITAKSDAGFEYNELIQKIYVPVL